MPLKVIDGSPTSISKFIREEEKRRMNGNPCPISPRGDYPDFCGYCVHERVCYFLHERGENDTLTRLKKLEEEAREG